ncbi:MFS transporter [Streptomyces sp. Ru73]|uniref:MFS transporter n=1 Tax=Streptomyces sp. Ru73 TaxID=2080748 RepID=UPI001CA5A709|nr:MFS transporter [Streptomyces sp. Ru73]
MLLVLTAGAYLPSALYPGYQHAFRADDLTMTLVHGVFALVGAGALVLLGPVPDTFGARPVLRAGIALAALGSACFALATGVGWLIAGHAAQGLALGATTGAAAALVSEETAGPGGRRGAVLAGTAFVAGTAAGAAAGGFLAQYAPAPYVLPFMLHLVLLAVAWYWAGALPSRADPTAPAAVDGPGTADGPGTVHGPGTAAASARLPRPVLPRRVLPRPVLPRIPRGMRALFATASAVGFLAWTTAGLFLTVIPALLARSGRYHPAVTGCVLAAVLVCSALTQPLVGRLGARGAQLVGLAGLLTGLSVLSLTAGRSLALTLAAAAVAGAGHGLAHAGAAAAVDARAPGADRSAVTSAFYVSCYLGSGLPAVAVGLLAVPLPLAAAVSLVTSAAAVLTLLTSAAVAEVDRTARDPKRTITYIAVKPFRDDVSA